MIDTISIWTGRVVLYGLALLFVWNLTIAVCLAIRDVYTIIRNVIDRGGAGWQWIGIPWVFFVQLGTQIDARIHGYKTNVIRSRHN